MLAYIKKLWNALTTGQDLYSLLATEFFRIWILPGLITAGALLVGILDHIHHNVPWIAVYAALVFILAMSAIAVLRLDEWREIRKVEGKLCFGGPLVFFDKTEDGTNIKVAQIGLQLENKARFPLSYKIKSIRTNVDRTLPSSGTFLNSGGNIASREMATFRDVAIDLKIPLSAASAELEFDLIYGLEGREKYTISKKINLSLRYDPKTGVLQYPWVYAPEVKA